MKITHSRLPVWNLSQRSPVSRRLLATFLPAITARPRPQRLPFVIAESQPGLPSGKSLMRRVGCEISSALHQSWVERTVRRAISARPSPAAVRPPAGPGSRNGMSGAARHQANWHVTLAEMSPVTVRPPAGPGSCKEMSGAVRHGAEMAVYLADNFPRGSPHLPVGVGGGALAQPRNAERLRLVRLLLESAFRLSTASL